MSRKPKAIRLSKETKSENNDKVIPKDRSQSTKTKPAPSRAKQAQKTSGEDRSPRVLPAPKLDDMDYDPFDQKPFIDLEEAPVVLSHLPDVSQGIKWGSVLLVALFSLLSLGFTLWIVEFVESLFVRNPILGWLSLGISGLFVIALLALIVREFVSIRKLKKIGSIRQDAEQVLLSNGSAKPVLQRLNGLYSSRPDMRWHLDELKSHDDDVMDEQDKIVLAEKILLSSLDDEAKQIIASSAKRISVITALNPSAVLDIIFVGYQVLQMLRKLMALYGGRPAFFSAMKLIRMVATHLAVTGGLAVSDTLFQQVLGKGLAGTVSRKIGEGTVNGIMATRIGLAAIDLCRPLPFKAVEQPALKGFIAELLGGKLGQKTQS